MSRRKSEDLALHLMEIGLVLFLFGVIGFSVWVVLP